MLFSLFAALVLKKIYGGNGEFVLEIPHLQAPRLSLLCKSLLFYVKQFIIKIATVVTAFLIVIWFLLSFNFSFQFVCLITKKHKIAYIYFAHFTILKCLETLDFTGFVQNVHFTWDILKFIPYRVFTFVLHILHI